MRSFFKLLDNRRSSLICGFAMLLAITLSLLAVFFGFVISLSAYLAIPIVLAGWYGSKRAGYIVAVFSSFLWIYVYYLDVITEGFLSDYLYADFMNLIAYFILALLITRFRGFHREEKRAADTDKLTGALNHRGFYAEFANEVIRSARYGHTFSLAYIDIDDFKLINDKLGHNIGDDVLIKTVRILQSSLRSTDSVSRIGGDEFACLLPETGYEEANLALIKLRDKLSEKIGAPGVMVNYSIGLVTFERPPDDVKQAMAAADKMMYSVKNNKKNGISSCVWRSEK